MMKMPRTGFYECDDDDNDTDDDDDYDADIYIMMHVCLFVTKNDHFL